MSSNPHHFITHTHDRDSIYPKFECTAPDTAPCHTYPKCDCESPCEHTVYPNKECWVKPWMDDSCAQECFVGEIGGPVRERSLIDVEFNGDCVEWTYLP